MTPSVPETRSRSTTGGAIPATLKIALFLLSGLAFVWLYAWVFGGGQTDTFYGKLTTPRSSSLILGTSRAGQGLQPALIRDGMVNFAFSITASPFGETYYRAIRDKLSGEKGGAFVLDVSPAGLSSWMTREPRENEDILGRLFIYSGNPNLNYLMRCYDRPLWALPLERELGPGELPALVHADGWTEVFDPPVPTPPEVRFRETLIYYEGILGRAHPSKERMRWLEQTCELLAKRGPVLMVRLPVGEDMRRLEAEYWPEFDGEMRRIAGQAGAEYLSLVEPDRDDWTTDGSHLTREAGERVSRMIGERLAAATRVKPPGGFK